MEQGHKQSPVTDNMDRLDNNRKPAVRAFYCYFQEKTGDRQSDDQSGILKQLLENVDTLVYRGV